VKGVHSEKAASGNKYNQNFQNRFCGCGEVYDAHSEKGTMFQCIGLGHVEDGGCGEDWWHPECITGLRRDWHKRTLTTRTSTDKPESDQAEKPEQDQGKKSNDPPQDNQVAKPEQDEENKSNDPPENDQVEKPEQDQEEKSDDPALPPGFPEEEDFEAFICYKCVESNSWIKRYAGTPGFLNAYKKLEHIDLDNKLPRELPAPIEEVRQAQEAMLPPVESSNGNMKVENKRKFEDDAEDDTMSTTSKRVKEDGSEAEAPLVQSPACKYESLPKAPFETLSLFCKEDFRDHICHCPTHFPLLKAHPQLLEEEENYEPPISESGDEDAASGARSHGTGSLLDRGEAALGNVDRVRAIEGVMAYNHMRDKVKAFLAPFAESGQPVGAEDIKKYFEKLRGDEEGIRAAAADKRGGGSGGDNRREQSGKYKRIRVGSSDRIMLTLCYRLLV
jgi:E3 ubiquitin-protein ligase UBR7